MKKDLSINIVRKKYTFEGELIGVSDVETVETSKAAVKRAREVVASLYMGNVPNGFAMADNVIRGNWLMLTIRPRLRGDAARELYNALLYLTLKELGITSEYVLEIDETANIVDYHIPICESVLNALGCV